MSFEIVKLEDVRNEILVDVREANEFAMGYFGEAINMPLSKLNLSIDVMQKFDKNATYVVYCVKGLRAKKAAEMMHADGFENVCLLDRGYA
ncbi:MAG: rhodanese-like domain-containing protein [Rhizobiales bacterium]|nr:rhodanese-like domain-containing protein [Hyphomicrobiales bacterium]